MRRSGRPTESGEIVDKLCIPVSAISAKGFAVDTVVSAAGLLAGGPEEPRFRDVAVSGLLTAVDSEYLFRGRLTGTFTGSCDRCLEATEQPFALDVVWFFEPGSEAEGLEGLGAHEEDEEGKEDDRIRYFEGGEIDLSIHLVEEVLLTAPAKSLCSEACAGLCPRCGAKLNEGPCGCSAADAMGNRGLSALADLFPELRPESTEE